MTAYRLLVFHEGASSPTATATVSRAPEVLEQITGLLTKHPDCHSIRVEGPSGFLFAVDCKGNTISE